MSILRERFSSESIFRGLLRTFPLLHQPARQHAGGVFLHPQIEKRADLLAEIGSMAEPPDFRPRLNEWVADFALAGKSALDGPDWASRMVLFRLYYLGLAPYENARHFLALSEHNWVNWTEQIRHRCGKELLGRSMFPPRKYFTNTE